MQYGPLLLFLVILLSGTDCLHIPSYKQSDVMKYLIVSSAVNSQIAYLKLTDRLPHATEGLRMLVDSGLCTPQGIAVDEYRGYLYVADPGSHALFRFRLTLDGDALRTGKKETLVDGVEVRWVAVDGLGNVFFSDEENHQIVKIPIELLEKTEGSDGLATVLYDGVGQKVSAPGGVAVDNYRLYWVNKVDGVGMGTLIQGSELGTAAPSNVTVLATNSPKCYGICLHRGYIYFTDEAHNIYGYNKRSGQVSTISDSLLEGRGCAGDGVGTIFVADKTANAVYEFPGTDPAVLTSKSVQKAVDFEGAYGVAVYSAAAA
mmetsp:Transcript_35979/g.66109  ORF Transcript_35979/g.66109 Transcript_35979/m.66109 type:complete len:317 (+) Transcript_35979:112-1062(+)